MAEAHHIVAFLSSMDEPEMAADVATMHRRLEAFAAGLDKECAAAQRSAFEQMANQRDTLLELLSKIVTETMDFPPVKPISADSWLPLAMIEEAQTIIERCRGKRIQEYRH